MPENTTPGYWQDELSCPLLTSNTSVSVDVDTVSSGKNDLPFQQSDKRPSEQHYTIVEITSHNRVFHARTIGKIRDFLRSMYREDLREGFLTLRWNGPPLEWDDSEDEFLQAPDGSIYRKDIEFAVGGKHVNGWVGVLAKGSRARAGFSIMHSDRVVKGWPDSWRPETLFGQFQGSNDLINQRLIGEIHMDEFEVSHTKDDILWTGNEEDEVQNKLKECCADYAQVAKTHRKGGVDQRGPSDIETATAIDEFKRELTSAEMADLVTIESVPSPDVVRQAILPLEKAVESREPTFSAKIGEFLVKGYLLGDASSNDPYLVVHSTADTYVMVIINTQHPHWSQIVGSEGVLNYLRHCTYDGIAEWQARHRASNLNPDTIKLLKDKLLRLPISMEMDGT